MPVFQPSGGTPYPNTGFETLQPAVGLGLQLRQQRLNSESERALNQLRLRALMQQLSPEQQELAQRKTLADIALSEAQVGKYQTDLIYAEQSRLLDTQYKLNQIALQQKELQPDEYEKQKRALDLEYLKKRNKFLGQPAPKSAADIKEQELDIALKEKQLGEIKLPDGSTWKVIENQSTGEQKPYLLGGPDPIPKGWSVVQPTTSIVNVMRDSMSTKDLFGVYNALKGSFLPEHIELQKEIKKEIDARLEGGALKPTKPQEQPKATGQGASLTPQETGTEIESTATVILPGGASVRIPTSSIERAAKSKTFKGAEVKMRTPDGKLGMVPMDAVTDALKQGYVIVK